MINMKNVTLLFVWRIWVFYCLTSVRAHDKEIITRMIKEVQLYAIFRSAKLERPLDWWKQSWKNETVIDLRELGCKDWNMIQLLQFKQKNIDFTTIMCIHWFKQ